MIIIFLEFCKDNNRLKAGGHTRKLVKVPEARVIFE